MRLDLHIHSTASDGAWAPEAVVRGAAAGGLDVIAIADHDTAEGFRPAEAAGREVGVEVIPAIEVSAGDRGRDIHVLGYFVDPDAGPLATHAARARGHRERRMHEMIARLAADGIEVGYDEVEAAAGPDRVVLGRPHLARALVAAGHAASVDDAFGSLIGDASSAFVPAYLLTPVAAVELVVASGGIAVWAHPPADLVSQLLPGLVRAGLRGLEVYRPRHRAADVRRLETIRVKRSLLASGGSDWHGPDAGTELGDFAVSDQQAGPLLEAGRR